MALDLCQPPLRTHQNKSQTLKRMKTTLVIVASVLVAFATADFADLSKEGAILPLNLTMDMRQREYRPFLYPSKIPSSAGFFGN